MTPRISVVLPTHNRANCLARSIHSVLDQTFRDLELIVIDDGSADDTPQVVGAIRDLRLRYEKLASRGGVSRARNRGVQLAQAAWIAFQDSDDAWLPDKLERQLAAVTSNAVLIVTRDRVVNDGALDYTPGIPAAANVTDLTGDAAFRLPPAATWLVRRDAFLAAGGFDAALDCYEDWELGLRLAQHGKILLANDVLVERTKTPGSLFSDEVSRLRNLRLIVERHRDRLERNPQAWSYYCNALGQMTAQTGSMHEARRWFIEAFRARPWSPRAWMNLLMSGLGKGPFARYVGLARSIRRRFPLPFAAK